MVLAIGIGTLVNGGNLVVGFGIGAAFAAFVMPITGVTAGVQWARLRGKVNPHSTTTTTIPAPAAESPHPLPIEPGFDEAMLAEYQEWKAARRPRP